MAGNAANLIWDTISSAWTSQLANPYLYKSLAPEEIRTLTILPGVYKDPLHGTLEQHLLGDATKPYEALSYVWGSPSRCRILRLGGHQVQITRNADALLRHLRDPKVGRRVWIDGICINQDDLTERCHQVPLMNAIYSRASLVLIWVGEADSHTGSVFGFLADLEARHIAATEEPRQLAIGAEESTDTKARPVVQKKALLSGESGNITEHQRDSFARIRAFADRPWFHRAWTFQEACLSAECRLLCGKYSMSWSTMVSAALFLTARGMVSAVFGPAADTLVALAHFSAANPSRTIPYLSILLPLTRMLEATDDRDKVYALLGLADRTGLPVLTPSYKQTRSQVYSLATKAMIAQEGGLSVLSSVYCARRHESIVTILTGMLGSKHREQAMASWVPDWRIPRRTAYLHGYDWASGDHLYHINQGAPFRNVVPSDPGTDNAVLPIRGAKIDFIVSIASLKPLLAHMAKYSTAGAGEAPETSDAWRAGLNQHLTRIRRRLGMWTDYLQTDCDMSECLMKTITADRGGVGEEGMGVWWTRHELVGSADRPVFEWKNAMNDEVETEEYYAMKRIVTMAWTFLNGRSIFKTERGLVGIVSEEVKIGDEVWDLVGGEVPFVLAAGRNGQIHRSEISDMKERKKMVVIGEAYVHGIMKGGLWEAERPTWPKKKQGRFTRSECRAQVVMGKDLEFEDIDLI